MMLMVNVNARQRVAAMALAAVSVTAVVASAQEIALSPAEIQEAIELGISGEPQPYLMRHRSGDGTNAVVVAAVYTPFLRVALASRAAWLEHRQLKAEDIPVAWLAPELHIAVRWYSRCGEAEPADPPQIVALARGWIGPASFKRGARPTQVHPGTAMLQMFGPVPYDDIVMVATYPLAVLRANRDFITFKEFTGGRCFTTGRIPAAELPRWR